MATLDQILAQILQMDDELEAVATSRYRTSFDAPTRGLFFTPCGPGHHRRLLEVMIERSKDQLDASPSAESLLRYVAVLRFLVGPATPRGYALVLVMAMAGEGNVAFRFLDRNLVAYQLAVRVLCPERVDQGRAGLCGPAAFVMGLLRGCPSNYVRLARDLLANGYARVGDLRAEPLDAIRTFDPGRSVPQADWLVLASLRNSATFMWRSWSYHIPRDLGTYGGTPLTDVFDWCQRCRYDRIVMISPLPDVSDADTTTWLRTSALRMLHSRVSTETNIRFFPGRSEDAPLRFDISDKHSCVRYMQSLCDSGWIIYLLADECVANAAVDFQAAVGRDDPLDRSQRVGYDLLQGWFRRLGSSFPCRREAVAPTGPLAELLGQLRDRFVVSPFMINVDGYGLVTERVDLGGERALAARNALERLGVGTRWIRIRGHVGPRPEHGDGGVVISVDEPGPTIGERARSSAARTLSDRRLRPHYMILSKIILTDRFVSYRVQSWGGEHAVFRAPLADFLFHFHGFVAATSLSIVSFAR